MARKKTLHRTTPTSWAIEPIDCTEVSDRLATLPGGAQVERSRVDGVLHDSEEDAIDSLERRALAILDFDQQRLRESRALVQKVRAMRKAKAADA